MSGGGIFNHAFTSDLGFQIGKGDRDPEPLDSGVGSDFEGGIWGIAGCQICERDWNVEEAIFTRRPDQGKRTINCKDANDLGF